MEKLTQAASNILRQAAAREDGAIFLPTKMNKASRGKLVGYLLDQKLVREVRAKAGMQIWRRDDGYRSLSLTITNKGKQAISSRATPIKAKSKVTVVQTDHDVRCGADASKGAIAIPKVLHAVRSESRAKQLRPGTKQALLVELMSLANGASLASLVDATGWLPHTVRAALTGLRKRGYEILKSSSVNGPTHYRIVTSLDRAA